MRTINIIGMGKGKELAPQEAENCWGVNSLIFERDVELHFDMHDSRYMKPHQIERRNRIVKVANEKNIPVYSCRWIPNTTYKRYPIEEVLLNFPRAYFSNAICYMIALALITDDVSGINLYGVNHAKVGIQMETYKFKDVVSSYDLDVMDESTREYVEAMWDIPQSKNVPSLEEYINQKPAVDYWIGVADGMSIEVNVCNPESELCKTRNGNVYGYGISQDEMVDRYGPHNRTWNGQMWDSQSVEVS